MYFRMKVWHAQGLSVKSFDIVANGFPIPLCYVEHLDGQLCYRPTADEVLSECCGELLETHYCSRGEGVVPRSCRTGDGDLKALAEGGIIGTVQHHVASVLG